MNIFELLGLQKNHRIKDKVTMKVKCWDEVAGSKKPTDIDYYGQVKKDGIYAHVIKLDSNYYLFSRTGLLLTNTAGLVKQLMAWGKVLPDGDYIAELCCDGCSLEALSGIFNPNRVKPLSKDQEQWCRDSYLCFHDHLTLNEFIVGTSEREYVERYSYLKSIMPYEFTVLDSVLIAYEDIEDLAEYYIKHGEEGIVIKRMDEGWVAGHKGYRMMKIVRGVDYDLECVGWEEGTGKYKGKVANLIFKWKNGETIKAMLGKGWTHEMAELMYLCLTNYHTGMDGYSYPIGKIFQVYALQESSKGVLRLPKVGELRFDKTEADV
jgi:ATP-dependent DNA ligase